MRRMLAAATAVAALAAAAGTAAATIVLRVTPRELADRAGLVVEGRVAAVDVRWDAERTCIHTWATVNVERTHKGVNASSIQVRCRAGRWATTRSASRARPSSRSARSASSSSGRTARATGSCSARRRGSSA